MIMKATQYTMILFLTMGMWANVSDGGFMLPQYVPVERLIKNATDYIQKNPKDASGYYTLGRIHYMAFVNKAFLVGAFNENPPNIIPFWWWLENYRGHLSRQEAKRIALKQYGYESTSNIPVEDRSEFWIRVRSIEDKLESEKWQPEIPTNEQLVEHTGAAQWNFYKAIALDPDNALYYLGQASLGKQYFDFLQETCPVPLPATSKAIILNTVKETYFLAYNLSIKKDLEREERPISGLRSIISYEAGSSFVRLWNLENKIPPVIQEKIIDIKQNLKTFETLRSPGITPIIFSLQENSSLSELLACDRIVPFDMDGNGYIEKRSWVKPTTGFLVWDSDGDGRITSGRELFGSVTWWLFFPDGYRAMDVLDDNRDGFLADGEFDGISVWFDRDSNGKSDIEEIVSIQSLGISAIATRPNDFDGKSPMHTSGLRLKDGRALPTYDWIAPSIQPLREKSLP
jgi:hypothetical protein